MVGYTGGTSAAPDYHHLGDHSEAVRVEFDPQQITYARLLEVFWASHDPTYAAYSRQYRSAIFYLDKAQRREAENSRRQVAATASGRVVTAVEPAGEFFAAENYHQKYLLRQAAGFFEEFRDLYPDTAAFTASTAAARVNGYLGCNGERGALEADLPRLGLSAKMQARLVEYVSASCSGFAGVTCPAPVADASRKPLAPNR